jgi:hypothetical protein
MDWGHEAERNCAAKRWGKAAAGHLADGVAGGSEDRRALAGRGTFDQEANADARKRTVQFGGDASGAANVACLAAALADGKAQSGFDR